jgi:hypothetical protein
VVQLLYKVEWIWNKRGQIRNENDTGTYNTYSIINSILCEEHGLSELPFRIKYEPENILVVFSGGYEEVNI